MNKEVYIKKWRLSIQSCVDKMPSSKDVLDGFHLDFIPSELQLNVALYDKNDINRKLTEEEFDYMVAKFKESYFAQNEEVPKWFKS